MPAEARLLDYLDALEFCAQLALPSSPSTGVGGGAPATGNLARRRALVESSCKNSPLALQPSRQVSGPRVRASGWRASVAPHGVETCPIRRAGLFSVSPRPLVFALRASKPAEIQPQVQPRRLADRDQRPASERANERTSLPEGSRAARERRDSVPIVQAGAPWPKEFRRPSGPSGWASRAFLRAASRGEARAREFDLEKRRPWGSWAGANPAPSALGAIEIDPAPGMKNGRHKPSLRCGRLRVELAKITSAASLEHLNPLRPAPPRPGAARRPSGRGVGQASAAQWPAQVGPLALAPPLYPSGPELPALAGAPGPAVMAERGAKASAALT